MPGRFGLQVLPGLVFIAGILPGAGRMATAQSALEPPQILSVCQIEYAQDGAGAVLLAWQNMESYEAVELSLDGAPAPGDVDGTFGRGRVRASPGSHTFGVRGRVGESASAWSRVNFTLLEASPLDEPVTGIRCELIPGAGNTLRVTWTPGSDVWVSGTLEIPGLEREVEIPAGATSAEISAEGAEPVHVAQLRFKNAGGYSSEPLSTVCVARTPAFRRGDCDGTGRINITDPIVTLNHLFLGGIRWRCDDACDVNDDGSVDLADPIAVLAHLFQGAGPLPPPGASECGVDPTVDLLGGLCGCP